MSTFDIIPKACFEVLACMATGQRSGHLGCGKQLRACHLHVFQAKRNGEPPQESMIVGTIFSCAGSSS